MRQVSTARTEPPDPEVVLTRLQRRCESIKQDEVERAVCKLHASRDLSDRERAAVEAMADRIVAALLAPPTDALENATADEKPSIAPLARLFDPAEGRPPAD